MTPLLLPELVTRTIAAHPYPLVFATISGAHLYGFPSPDSDYDVRGVHVLPAAEILGLRRGRDTIETMLEGPPEVDLVTHDAEKFFRLLLKRNGYVLEQVLSPLVASATPEHEELRELARRCITRHHAHHYLGFSENQWRLFGKEHPRRLKPLLYVFRVLLTGIHLMRTGEIECDLSTLVSLVGVDLPYVPDLIERKARAEKEPAEPDLRHRLQKDVDRLTALLEQSRDGSRLPDRPSTGETLHRLVVETRLA